MGFAIDALSYNVSAVGGPAVVALLTLVAPVQIAVLALAASAVLGAVVVFSMGLPSHAGASQSVLRAITGGVKWMLGHRPLAVLTAASTLSQVGQGGLAVAAIAVSIERVGSPDQAAFVVTAFAVGALVGSLYEGLRPTRSRPQKVMMLGFLMTGLLTIGATFDLRISALATYLYGSTQEARRDSTGLLRVTPRRITEHKWGQKTVPSGFFSLPGAEHVSAVIFNSSATISKFNRMGVGAGFGSDKTVLIRKGFFADPDPQASQPQPYVHFVAKDDPETWIEGMDVYHNPRAKHPLEPRLLPDAAHHRLTEDGQIETQFRGWKPLQSRTSIMTF